MTLKIPSLILTSNFFVWSKNLKTCLFFLIILTQTSCNKYPKRGESLNRGEIIDNFQLPECYSIKTFTNTTCIIRSVADLDTIEGSTCVPAAIDFDFNSFSILGQEIKFDCSAKIIREVKIDHNKKLYTYTVKFKDLGICKKLGIPPNLVIVPKIPDDYKVEFNVQEE